MFVTVLAMGKITHLFTSNRMYQNVSQTPECISEYSISKSKISQKNMTVILYYKTELK